MSEEIYNGLIPFMEKISNDEINEYIRKWLEQNPNERMTNKLRMYAINDIIEQRSKKL